MLHVRQLGVHVAFNADDMRRAIRAMGELGWTPATLTADDHFLSLADLEPGALGPDVRLDQRRYRRHDDDGVAEVFFSENDMYFCYASNDMWELQSELVDPRRGPRVARHIPPLVVGVITRKYEDVDVRLREFAESIQESLGRVMDGRRFRHLDFSWEPLGQAQNPVASLVERLQEEGAEPTFKEPDSTPDDIAASEVMADESARQLLIELSSAGGFAREQDILAKRGDKEESVRATLERLTKVGLLTNEYLLQCRSTSTPLTRLPDKSALEEDSVASLRCANCSRAYSEELCLLGVQVTERGKALLDGSHWMTVWISNQLNNIGIPAENIRWSLAETSEEIDVIAEVAGQLWIIELKARDFGPGDAYPFSYRRARYGPDEAFVVTTGRVTEDAKRVFEELSREWRGRGSEPQVIEGLENAEGEFRNALWRATLVQAMDVVQPVARLTGFQVGRVLGARYASGV